MLGLKEAALLAPLALSLVHGAPTTPYANWPVPGEAEIYDTYYGKAPPFPGNLTKPILPTSNAAPAPDDQLFQNLAAAEWIIYSFYQTAVEKFNTTSFTALGLPNTTYRRVQEIRDNEAGHLNIFYRSISTASTKPGPCKYNYGFTTPQEFLVLQLAIEIGSMAFLSGLEYQAKEQSNRAALLAISDVETRHAVWALSDVWDTDPFSGPSDTAYPYANQILQITNQFVVNGSCPKENPAYPTPNQHLPTLSYNASVGTGHPGSVIELLFPAAQPAFSNGTEYHAVFFHGVNNVTVPFHPAAPKVTIPAQIDSRAGTIIVAIADTPGAPSAESVVAGPLILIEQPQMITLEASGGV